MATKKTILVIDDEPVITQLIESRLRTLDYDVLLARDGVEGLEIAVKNEPDLVITDVLMPRMSGYDFLKALRGKSGRVRTAPVLMMSARPEMKEFFATSDIADFLPKPFTAEILIEKVHKALGIRTSEEVKKALSMLNPEAVRSPQTQTTSTATGCKVMVLAVQDFILEQIQNFLKSKGHSMVRALDTADALQTATSEKPNFILCQYWEERNVIDAVHVFKTLRAQEATKSIPFYAFCPNHLTTEAIRDFRAAQLICYHNTDELLKNISSLALKS